jgi:CubicO group peptidase (beta-lactamase class C family)
MRRYGSLPLVHQPGEQWMYDTGSNILGVLIARVSGKTFGTFLREQIFEPLDMHDTGIDTRAVLKHRAAGYKDRGRTNADYVDLSNLQAAGGMYSTVEDLYRWDQALKTEQLVPKTAIDTMFTQHSEVTTHELLPYGYGWEIYEQDGRRMVAHIGAAEGFSGLTSRYPDDNTVVIVLNNLSSPSTKFLCIPPDFRVECGDEETACDPHRRGS